MKAPLLEKPAERKSCNTGTDDKDFHVGTVTYTAV